MTEKEQIKKADRHQDKMHKYHVEAREVQDKARNAPYKAKVARKMPDVSRREENKVLKSVAKKGYYEMSDKRKKEISAAWEKAKPGSGFMK